MNLLLLFATGWAMDNRNVQYSPEDAAVIIGYLRNAGQDIPPDLLNMERMNNDIQYQNNVINIQNDSIDNVIQYQNNAINIQNDSIDNIEDETPKPALIVSSNQAVSKTEKPALIESSIEYLSLNSVQFKNQELPEGFKQPVLTGSDFKNVECEKQTDWKQYIFEDLSAGKFVDDVTLSKLMYSNPIEPSIMIDSSMTKQEIAEQIKEAYWYKVDDNFEYKNFWSRFQRTLVREFIDLLDEAALKSKNLFSVLKDFERKAWLAIKYGFRKCLCNDPYHNSYIPARSALVLYYALKNPKLPIHNIGKLDDLYKEFEKTENFCSKDEQELLEELKARLIQELKILNDFCVHKMINNIAMKPKFIL